MSVTYQYDLTIPAMTPKTQPVSKFVSLERGRLYRVVVFFPWGHAGLTGFRVTRGEEQIFPFPPGSWLIGNDEVYDYPARIIIDDEPVGVTLEGYNEDEYFDHTVYCTLMVEPEAVVARLVDFFRIFIGGR